MSHRKPIRKAPAYLEYATDVLASKNFRALSMAQRGLWHTMRMECWANGSVPANKKLLSKYVAVDLDQLDDLLSPELMSWFIIDGGDIRCPELDLYRQQQLERKQAEIEGGRKGGLSTQKKYRAEEPRQDAFDRVSPLEATLKPLRGDETRGFEKKGEESLVKVYLTDEQQAWVDDYDNVQIQGGQPEISTFNL